MEKAAHIKNYSLGFAALVSYIVIISPLLIIIRNQHDFGYGPIPILTIALPTFLAIMVPLLLLGIFLYERLTLILTNLSIFFFIVFVLTGELLYGSYGPFDGKVLGIDIYSVNSIIQIASISILVLLFIFTNIQKNLFFVFATVVFCQILVIVPILLNDHSSLSKTRFKSSDSFSTLSSSNKNFLYILLDEVYGGSAQEVFSKNPDLQKEFSGFTNYTNSAGVYSTTVASIPSVFSGNLYKENSDLDQFIDSNLTENSSLLATYSAQGYDTQIHSLKRYCYTLPQNICSPMGSFIGLPLDSEYYKVLAYSAFKIVPDFLKASVHKKIFPIIENGHRYLDEFNHLERSLKVDDQPPTFRYFHSLLTHSPVRFDKYCSPLEVGLEPTFEGHLQQDECGFKQVAKLFEKLRQLGIYDNTYIIVSSDHGRGTVSAKLEKIFSESSSRASAKEYGYAHTTLLVKPFAATEKFKSSDKPISLLDIRTLLLSEILDKKPEPNNDRIYHHYILNNWNDKSSLPSFSGVYTIGNDITDPKQWGYDATYMIKKIGSRLSSDILCEQDIHLGSNGNKDQVDRFIQSTGLSGTQKLGRWSYHKVVEFFFSTGKSCTPKSISLTLKAFINGKNNIQEAYVTLNGTKIGKISMALNDKNPSEIAFRIPPRILTMEKPNILSIEITNPVSPKSLGIGTDSRALGFFFKSIRFDN